MGQKTVVFDFDGVIHSYTSGFTCIADNMDPPVPGIKEAIDDIRKNGYYVVVVSSRCADPLGKESIWKYLWKYNITVDDVRTEKPPAVAYIDDRAICFDGDPTTLLSKIQNLTPWNRKDKYK